MEIQKQFTDMFIIVYLLLGWRRPRQIKSQKLQMSSEFRAVPKIILNLQIIMDFNSIVCTFAGNVLVSTAQRRSSPPAPWLGELVPSLLFSQMDCEGRNHTIGLILSPSMVTFSGDKHIIFLDKSLTEWMDT